MTRGSWLADMTVDVQALLVNTSHDDPSAHQPQKRLKYALQNVSNFGHITFGLLCLRCWAIMRISIEQRYGVEYIQR